MSDEFKFKQGDKVYYTDAAARTVRKATVVEVDLDHGETPYLVEWGQGANRGTWAREVDLKAIKEKANA
jgi:hypothetical protein